MVQYSVCFVQNNPAALWQRENITAGELEKGGKRWKETVLSSITALSAYSEGALGLQDGASRRELAQSRRCFRGAEYRNNVNLKSVEKQEAS